MIRTLITIQETGFFARKMQNQPDLGKRRKKKEWIWWSGLYPPFAFLSSHVSLTFPPFVPSSPSRLVVCVCVLRRSLEIHDMHFYYKEYIFFAFHYRSLLLLDADLCREILIRAQVQLSVLENPEKRCLPPGTLARRWDVHLNLFLLCINFC